MQTTEDITKGAAVVTSKGGVLVWPHDSLAGARRRLANDGL
jgi:hypothetical protein